MSGSIRISPKHGVNPSMSVCFWCNKEKNEILLLGRLPGDREAPRRACVNYDPCDECAEKFTQGIHAFEATEHPAHDGFPPLSKDSPRPQYPTGRYFVVDRDAFLGILQPEATRDAVARHGKCALDTETFEMLFGHLIEAEQEAAES